MPACDFVGSNLDIYVPGYHSTEKGWTCFWND